MKKISQLKVKAGLLPFTIAMSIILSMICGVMFLFLYYNNLLWILHSNESRALNNLRSGHEMVLAMGDQAFPLGQVLPFDLYGEQKDSLLIQRNKWGVFNRFSLEARAGRCIKKSFFLTGKTKLHYEHAVLYLADQDGVGLTLIGTATINGNAYLPRQGVQAGYLNHQSFLGRRLVNGNREKSSAVLPEVSEEVKTVFQELFALRDEQQVEDISELPATTFHHPFILPTRVFYSDAPISLNQSLSGNIIICSKSSVDITSSCEADNIIVVAPQVSIKTHFIGNLQVFASERIEVESQVKLTYPSILVCENKAESVVQIGNRSQIEGGVYHLSFAADQNELMGHLFIGDALLKGQVYSSGKVELLGTIYGQLLCNKTIYRDRYAKVYSNYLVEGVLDCREIPAGFLFPPVLNVASYETELLRKL